MTIGESRSPETLRRSTAGTIGYLLFGPIVWAAHLTAIYFSQSMLCAHGLSGGSLAGIGVVPAVIVAVTAACLALLIGAILVVGGRPAPAGDGPDQALYRRTTIALAVLSAVGVAWAGVTAFVVPDCPQLR